MSDDKPSIPRTVSHTDFRDLRGDVHKWVDEDRKEHADLRADMRKHADTQSMKFDELRVDVVDLKLVTTKQNVMLETIVRQTRREEGHVDKAIERTEDTKAHLLVDARKTRNRIIVTAVGFICSAAGGGALIHWLVSR